jgi:nitric oxide reductase NorQ protein
MSTKTHQECPMPTGADLQSQYRIRTEPYYVQTADEVALFTAAFSQHLPLMLKGPTGCGKTRFIEYMAWRLKRPFITVRVPRRPLFASDLTGRFLLKSDRNRVGGRAR